MSVRGLLRRLAVLALLTGLALPAGAEVTAAGAQLQLRFADNGDLLEAVACLTSCAQAGAHRQLFGAATPVVAFTSFATEPFELERLERADGVELRFEDAANGSYRRWRIPAEGWRLELSVAGSERLDLDAGPALEPPEAYGFGVWLEQLRYVLFGEHGAEVYGLEDAPAESELAYWSGFRNRFWTLMLLPGQALSAQLAAGPGTAHPAMVLDLPASELQASLYLGPVEPAALRSADPVLHGMMYASLWFWLRWIC
ncbi:MAG: hypothetical protein ACK2U9_14870, partial [Anaerolineae bacterium]